MPISRYSRRARKPIKKSVKTVKSSKKTPKVKTVNKKTNYNRRALTVLNHNQRLIDKVLATKMSNKYFAYVSVNESFDSNSNQPGSNILTFDDTISNTMPCHIYHLTGHESANTSGVRARRDLKTDLHDFATPNPSNYTKTATTGYAAVPTPNDEEHRFMLHRYSNIKMVLWGREAFQTTYNIKLLRLMDSDLDPFENDTITDTTKQYTREAFYSSMMKQHVSNPIATSKHHLSSFKNKFKIVWEKNYTIREKLSTEDQMKFKIVKIFRQHDRLLDYASESRLANFPADNIDNPEEELTVNETVTNLQDVPKQGQRLFLMVTANVTKKSSEGAVSTTDWPSYDISITNKFSCLGAN